MKEKYMNIKMTIVFSNEWILSHRDDDILPIAWLKQNIQQKCSLAVKIEKTDLISMDFIVETEETGFQLETLIQHLLQERYGVKESIYTIEYTNGALDGAKSQDHLEKVAQLFEEEQEITKVVQPVDEILATIDGLIGAEEYKALMHEIAKVAPQIIHNQTFDTFLYQSYIFSINDGYGLTSYLSLFAQLVDALGLQPMFTHDPILEVKLEAPKGETLEPFAYAMEQIAKSKRGKGRILCIDMSEWMNETNHRAFKYFLQTLENELKSYIVIFRIPFIDKEILAKIRYSLNDLLFVRDISFQPFTNEELQIFALAEIQKYGFTVQEQAWSYFHERITEEKSDGKFYGLNTVQKVVRELLYKKQLSNANQNENHLIIEATDTQLLCNDLKMGGVSAMELLDELIGGKQIKASIEEIITQIEFAKQNKSVDMPCIHMRFLGNPGTGKTTVARLIGQILKEKGILRVGNFYEYSGRDFCGRYVGETAPKTASMCRDAYGSVLFIDEAYALYRSTENDKDYGREALDTLIAEMENHRSDLLVIMAGYTENMDQLMKANVGLASRMPYQIDFPNFTKDDLQAIFMSMVKKKFTYHESLFQASKAYFDGLSDEMLQSKEFSNGRFVRNLFERTWAKAAMRCQLEKKDTLILEKDDFIRSTSESEFKTMMAKKERYGFY